MLDKSIDFLLENAGPVIQYRLRKEVLHNLTSDEEAHWLGQIYQTPHFKLVQSYAKPNGYIGIGMHGRDKWHETRLQDSETAARLLSHYAIPKDHPLIANYVAALRDDEVLRHEFSDYPPDAKRFEKRYNALNSGSCLMGLVYTLSAMLGYGDDTNEVLNYQDICLKGFKRVLEISSLNEITKEWKSKSNKYGYRILPTDEFFPCCYTLAFLAYTYSWRTPENVNLLADALNHINKIMEPCLGLNNGVVINSYGNLIGPFGALTSPIKTFRADVIDTTLYRRPLTEIAMLGVGERADVISVSVSNVQDALDADGILRMDFTMPHNKHYSPRYLEYPSGYSDVRLEPYYEPRKKEPIGLLCDLTFWAVQFITLVNGNAQQTAPPS